MYFEIYAYISWLNLLGARINEFNKEKKTPLHYAVLRDNMELIELLLDSGANPNAEDAIGTKPLNLYFKLNWISNIHTRVIKKLLNCKRSININSKDNDGNTLMHLLCQRKNQHARTKTYKLLIGKGNIVEKQLKLLKFQFKKLNDKDV